MIEIKTDREIQLISEACAVVKSVLRELKRMVKPGVSTIQLDGEAEKIIRSLRGKPAFKGYKGFPGTICASVNEEVVHGIPGKRRLRDGDILSIDVGAEKSGFYGDAAVTVEVGRAVPESAKKLLLVTENALSAGIMQAREGCRLFDVSSSIQDYAESRGYSVVRSFVGHGIGSRMHEEPEIPNYGKAGTGPRLKKGMVLAVEPMINQGTYEIEILEDNWTAVTRDRKLSAHFEHTICVTEGEPRILTQHRGC